jgi:hypothetical protein
MTMAVDDLGQKSVQSAVRLMLTAREAANACGKSLRTWRAWDAGGLVLAPRRIGRSTLWVVDELKDWIRAGCPKRSEWEVLRSGTL